MGVHDADGGNDEDGGKEAGRSRLARQPCFTAFTCCTWMSHLCRRPSFVRLYSPSPHHTFYGRRSTCSRCPVYVDTTYPPKSSLGRTSTTLVKAHWELTLWYHMTPTSTYSWCINASQFRLRLFASCMRLLSGVSYCLCSVNKGEEKPVHVSRSCCNSALPTVCCPGKHRCLPHYTRKILIRSRLHDRIQSSAAQQGIAVPHGGDLRRGYSTGYAAQDYSARNLQK